MLHGSTLRKRNVHRFPEAPKPPNAEIDSPTPGQIDTKEVQTSKNSP